MKKMKNIGKILSGLIMVLIVVAAVFATRNKLSAATTTAPDSFRLGSIADMAEPRKKIGETYFPYKQKEDGTKVFCLDHSKDPAQNITVNKVGELDAGIAYIINNGWVGKSSPTDNDYYVTQSAIFWYLDDTKGTSNLGSGFKSTGQDDLGLRSKVIALKEAAKTHNTYSTPSITPSLTNISFSLNSDESYYISDKISVTANSITGNYTVSLTGAPTGTLITDSSTSTTNKTSYSQSAGFYIKVPASSVTGSTINFTVKLSATGQVEKAYEYRPTNTDMQNIATLYYENSDVSASMTAEIAKNTVVKIKKVRTGDTTQTPIAGATLQIYNRNSDGTADTSSGVISGGEFETTTDYTIFENLKVGKYVVVEKTAPNGYERTTQLYPFNVAADGEEITVSVENRRKDPTVISVLKTDESGNPLSGARLKIYKKNADGTLNKDYVVPNGEWETTTEAKEFNLDVGNYAIVELQAPSEYITPEQDTILKSFTVSYDNGTPDTVADGRHPFAIVIQNTHKDKSKIKILKVDENGNPLIGAEFQIKDSSGNVKDTFPSTTTAYEVPASLGVGTYTLHETKAPDNYRTAADKTFTISYDGGEVQTITVANTLKNKTVVNILKTDEDGNALKGAKLRIYKLKEDNTLDKSEVVKEWTSELTAQKYTDIKPGKYAIVEVQAPDKYILPTADSILASFTVAYDDQTLETIKIKNYKKPVVTIRKIDSETRQQIAGATLVIKNASGNVVGEPFETKNTPNVFDNLSNGKYTVEEIEAPNGYRKSNEKKEFTISSAGQIISVEFVNEKIRPTQISVRKIDSKTGNPVYGAIMAFVDSNNEIKLQWKIEKELYVFNDANSMSIELPVGKYKLVELEAPEGYFKSNEEVEVIVSYDDRTPAAIKFKNTIKPGTVTISKQDFTTKEEIEGATLVVKDSNGEVVDTWESKKEPHVIDNLEDGTYTLSETIAPEGYILNTETISFEIVSGTVTEPVVMYNVAETPVPKTAANISILVYITGMLAILGGSVLVYNKIKLRKNS